MSGDVQTRKRNKDKLKKRRGKFHQKYNFFCNNFFFPILFSLVIVA